LRGALRESLAHKVRTGCVERACCSTFGDRSQSTDGERHSENAEIVVVHLIAQACIANLVETLELIEAYGIAVRHEHSMEYDGQTCLAESVHFLGFAKQL
jgi:hypothetical protein